MPEVKKLYRSRTDRMISGVCGGLAKYFEIDTTWIRLAFAVSLLFGGAGGFLYLLMMVVVPEEPTT